ncbi:MAG TPA: hypothetical protein DIS78_04585 [Lachnospiraceae bacterium]|nr:hypothetical protein [Lachnospiraceae bacterium]
MSYGENVTINLKHKDRLFNFIFGKEENRKWTLSLYNAVNGSDHDDESMIEFNTLEDVMYLSMKNDTSFLIGNIMSVYEHQSSFNPNMPLRMMEYVGRLYSGYISKNKFNKYGEKLIMLPTPKLVVFYNGLKEQADESILRLSDSFDKGHRNEADIEVRVRMLNVNHGRNKELMDRCKPLAEYAWFIDEIRKNRKEHDTESSVRLAIEAMPDDCIIKGFLTGHMKEVEGMLDTEYNEAEVKELFKEEGREEGREQEVTERIQDMLRRGKTVAEITDFCGYPKEQVEKVEKSMLTMAE